MQRRRLSVVAIVSSIVAVVLVGVLTVGGGSAAAPSGRATTDRDAQGEGAKGGGSEAEEEAALAQHESFPEPTLGDILEADIWARNRVAELARATVRGRSGEGAARRRPRRRGRPHNRELVWACTGERAGARDVPAEA